MPLVWLLSPLLPFPFVSPKADQRNPSPPAAQCTGMAGAAPSYLPALLSQLSLSPFLSLWLASVVTELPPQNCDFKAIPDYIHKLPTATRAPGSPGESKQQPAEQPSADGKSTQIAAAGTCWSIPFCFMCLNCSAQTGQRLQAEFSRRALLNSSKVSFLTTLILL